MNNLISRFKTSIKEKRFFKSLFKKIYPYLIGLILTFVLKKKKIKLCIPKNDIIDDEDLPLSGRIFEFYKKMKKDQSNKGGMYIPSSLWQKHIDKDFFLLKESFKENDNKKFLNFIQNFGNRNYLGVESQDLIQKYSKNLFLRNFMEEEIFGGHLKMWKLFNMEKEDFSSLNIPRFGNQNGAKIEENFVVLGSFFADIYSKILINYLNKKDHNYLCDLGSGYGYFDYYILKNLKNRSTFVCIDIPETLTLAAYFLSKAFPEKKVFLYGEKKLNFDKLSDYELIFLPSWEIENLKDDSLELMINKNSLGEMKPSVALNYLKQIHRTSNYFFSMNHEVFRNKFSDGTSSLINKEFNINNQFQELIRYPDLSHLTFLNNKIDLDSDIFFYIYKKNTI